MGLVKASLCKFRCVSVLLLSISLVACGGLLEPTEDHSDPSPTSSTSVDSDTAQAETDCAAPFACTQTNKNSLGTGLEARSGCAYSVPASVASRLRVQEACGGTSDHLAVFVNRKDKSVNYYYRQYGDWYFAAGNNVNEIILGERACGMAHREGQGIGLSFLCR